MQHASLTTSLCPLAVVYFSMNRHPNVFQVHKVSLFPSTVPFIHLKLIYKAYHFLYIFLILYILTSLFLHSLFTLFAGIKNAINVHTSQFYLFTPP